MCYDIKSYKRSQLKKAKHFGDEEQVNELEREIEQLEIFDYHHVSGFSHPKLPIITNDQEKPFKIATWGLIPFWVKDMATGLRFYNKTLNARSETIFEKNSFKYSAKNKRCLIVIDGFYEHHHRNGTIYPYYIHTDEPLILAGLWNYWKKGEAEMQTFSIVTTKANAVMAKIHNNPKLAGPRMPVILNDELGKKYLEINASDKAGQDEVLELCQPSDIELQYHTVNPLRGKARLGNVPEASEYFEYGEQGFF